MFLVELVLQGVRGIRELARLRFQGGFNLVAAGNESGKTSSVDSVLRLLFPSNQAGAFDGLISRYAPDASRAALVVYSDDGLYYRVIQDFSKGGINLSKYNTATKDFGLLYKDWEQTTEFMAELSGGISEQDYAGLFVLRREHYTAAAAPAAAAEVRQPARQRPAEPKKKGTAAAQEARLAELREALQKAEEAADVDYQLQTAKLKLEEIKSKMVKLEEIDGRAAEIDAELESLRACEKLPPDLNAKLEEHDHRQREKMVKSDDLNKDIEDLTVQLDRLPAPNLFKDPLFIGGAVLGALSVIAGLFALTSENYFLIGVVLAFVLIAVGWYKGSRKSAERNAVAGEIERIRTELRDVEKSFTQGGGPLEQAMKAAGATTAAELKDKVDRYRHFLSMREELNEQQARVLRDSTREDIQREYEKQLQEVQQVEREAASVSRQVVDTYSLRQDIDRIEAEIAAGSGPDFEAGGVEAPADFAFAAPVTAGGAPSLTAALGAAGRISGIEMEILLPAVESAVQRNLSAASGGKYVRVEIGHEGEPAVHLQDHSVVKVSSLSHGTKDLFYFCFRAGLVEALAGKRRLPFILDDALAGFDPGRQQSACQVLRSLGSKTQVILLASNPALRAPGDAALELK